MKSPRERWVSIQVLGKHLCSGVGQREAHENLILLEAEEDSGFSATLQYTVAVWIEKNPLDSLASGICFL